MQSNATTVKDYVAALPDDRRAVIERLRKTVKMHLSAGTKETMSYGMIGYVIPHSKYPAGYHCDPKLPLPFINIASQKNFIALYHSGIYAKKELYDWFVEEYPKHCDSKIDMGKSCIRFKKMDQIPYELIAELLQKMSPDQWIEVYESTIKPV